MESGEAAAEAQVPNGGGSIRATSPPRAHLPLLPTELLLPIFSHLPLSSLSALSLTCRSLRHSVDEVGWTAWLIHGEDERTKVVKTLPEEERLSGKERVRRLVTCDEVWQQKKVRSRQVFFRELPGIAPAPQTNGRQQQRSSFRGEWPALPLARLCVRGLLVAMRSLVVLWDGAALARPAGLCSNEAKPKVYKLFDEAQQQEQQRGEPSGWEEINAFEIIDAPSSVSKEGMLVAVGRFHGVLELWRLPSTGAAQLVATYAAGRGEGAKPSTSSVQGLSYLAAQKLLAVGWKDGHVALFTTQEEGRLEMLHRWLMPDVKIWSIHLGLNTKEEAPWLAVGCQGSTPLIIQRDVLAWAKEAAAVAAAPAPPPPAALPSPPPANLIHLLNSSYTSVYALASTHIHTSSSSFSPPPTFPPHLLFAGCFNGQIVALDISQPSGTVVATYRDAYDDSPVYSLALGVASGSRSLAAGTGRHGCVKLYEHVKDAQQQSDGDRQEGEEGWTLFPPQPSCSSPTYSVVGDHGRLFCAGRERIWEFDARGSAEIAREEEGVPSRGVGVGWYRHREMVLMRTCEGEDEEEEEKVGRVEEKRGNWKGRRGRGRRR